ncbi:class I SAM-dependent methyltransferase [Petroclostridium sp. X23]|uniref:class I SAM-dependent methyltransferase n=1 Tax=Petroclostridium sp. X23 TaxID=3045146 RepID=UPI0024AD8F6E|nr:class I SAM-dependent methyltransferase [Petroclostridium sp. X23]WHH60735.1 class I SAM-dependent methyltransferase [Petroclostridium sp. X23]
MELGRTMKVLKNSLRISHDIVEKVVCEGDVVVDATAGNGNDTLFLAKLVGESGHIYSFDIQDIAIEKTKEKLEAGKVAERVTLIKDGHQNIDKYLQKDIKAAMFNLGYLPGGNHSVHTTSHTTILAIQKCLDLLVPHGIVMLVIYYGGDSGFDEKGAVMNFLSTLDCKKYSVLMHDFINQINCPPIAVCIEKL